MRLRECKPCTHQRLVTDPAFEHCYKIPHQILLGGGHPGRSPSVPSYAWQSNKTIVFNFTPLPGEKEKKMRQTSKSWSLTGFSELFLETGEAGRSLS